MKMLVRVLVISLIVLYNNATAQKKNFTISEKIAVIVMPSQEKIKQLKKESASDDEYSVIVEDGLFYLDQAKTFLKKKNIKILQVAGSQNVHYLENNSYKKLNIKNLSWDILFYMPKKKPKQIDITDVEKEYQNYFLTIKKTK